MSVDLVGEVVLNEINDKGYLVVYTDESPRIEEICKVLNRQGKIKVYPYSSKMLTLNGYAFKSEAKMVYMSVELYNKVLNECKNTNKITTL